MGNDLKSITEKIIQFTGIRDWRQYHDPKNLSQALNIEQTELQEIFLWKARQESRELCGADIDTVSDETADIFIYPTYIRNEFKIDFLASTRKKIEKNGEGYPVEKSKGSNRKYDEQ